MSENQPINIQIPPSDGKQFVFPAYWGGAVQSGAAPLIHAKLRELRLHVGGVAAKKQAGGAMFPVKGAKEVAQKLAQALVDLNMVAPVVAQEIHYFDTKDIPDNKTASGKPVFRTLVHVKSTVRLGAEDGSFVEVVGSGHGGDVDDKAGGKASTYAWKDAILKGLTVPEADMLDTDDEAPSDEGPLKRQPSKAEVRGGAAGETTPSTPKTETSLGRAAEPSKLADTLKAISEATTVERLEEIKAQIKSGETGLAGADKLRVSTAFVARRRALEEPNA